MDKHYWKSQPYDFIDTNNVHWSMLDVGDDTELFVEREVLLIMQQYPRTFLPRHKRLKGNIVSFTPKTICVSIDSTEIYSVNYKNKIYNLHIEVARDYSNGIVLYIRSDDDYIGCKGVIN
tara:strand:+ start:300 stop:659 length:360 start_codon:yes stop_codon:yes gene_type:complete